MEIILIATIVVLAFTYLMALLRRSLLNIVHGKCSNTCTSCTRNKSCCNIDGD